MSFRHHQDDCHAKQKAAEQPHEVGMEPRNFRGVKRETLWSIGVTGVGTRTGREGAENQHDKSDGSERPIHELRTAVHGKPRGTIAFIKPVHQYRGGRHEDWRDDEVHRHEERVQVEVDDEHAPHRLEDGEQERHPREAHKALALCAQVFVGRHEHEDRENQQHERECPVAELNEGAQARIRVVLRRELPRLAVRPR